MALTLVTSDLIHGLDYSKLTGTIPTWNQDTTGNAATATLAAGATILATARNIGGVSFNGSAAIDLPGVNTAGNQNTSGVAATATLLATARNINSVAFDGSADITIADATKLPLAGGTLTGALSGTSATFSGSVTSNSYFNSNDGTRDFYFNPGANYGGGALPTIQVFSNHALQFATNNALAMTITSGGNVGIGIGAPLGKLSTIGGAVQIMGDYRNHQTIIKSAGTTGTLSGSLLITIPQMSNGNVDGYGGYSCEVYVAGYPGLFCHAWFGGYVNGGLTNSEATILRSSGGWSISQTSYGANNQGFQFTIDYPPYIVHPTARIIFNKGGSPNSTEYPANQITAVFS